MDTTSHMVTGYVYGLVMEFPAVFIWLRHILVMYLLVDNSSDYFVCLHTFPSHTNVRDAGENNCAQCDFSRFDQPLCGQLLM